MPMKRFREDLMFDCGVFMLGTGTGIPSNGVISCKGRHFVFSDEIRVVLV